MNGNNGISDLPVATYSRLNNSGEIEIEHLNAAQTLTFFSDIEYKSALPRDSIFLQKYIRSDIAELRNHFIKV